MSLPGLPPLPKSLIGGEASQPHHQLQQQLSSQINSFQNLHQLQQQQPSYNQLNSYDSQRSLTSTTSSSAGRTASSTLDAQLAVLRREMVSIIIVKSIHNNFN
jgi:uncharacterized protein RhaS with RHS repeats